MDESAAASGVSGYPIAVGGNEEGDAGLAAIDARQPPTGHSVEKRRRKSSSLYSYVYRPNRPLKRCIGCKSIAD